MKSKHVTENIPQRPADQDEKTDWLESIFNLAEVGITVLDKQGRILHANPFWLKLTGYSNEEVNNIALVDQIHPGDINAWQESLQRLKDGKAGNLNSVVSEQRFCRKDGSFFWGEVSVTAQRDSQGNLCSLILILADISDHKKAEAAISAQSFFLASMSHEIRTPLHGVVGMTSLLYETDMSQEQQNFVNIIRSSSETLLTLINNILDLSKIEAGKFELESIAFDLRACIEDTMDMVAGKASEKKIELAYFMELNVPEVVVGDRPRLSQILINLLHNAVKFTDIGEVILEVRLENVEHQQIQSLAGFRLQKPQLSTLHFIVRDTGLGIPEDKKERLFTPFSQVEPSTTRKYGGSGLGLSISRQLCDLMGGQMWVESEGIPGKGSSFHFTIVVEEGMVEYSTNQSQKQPRLEGKKLLFVDNNEVVRKILTSLSGLWGATSRSTAFAKEALNWIHHGEAFDLAILDMQMPEIDGIHLAEIIHKSKVNLPLIMLTSIGSHDRHACAPTDLFSARLNKPIRAAQLFDVLSSVLSTAGEPTLKGKQSQGKPRLDPLARKMAEKRPIRILLVEDNPINQQVVKLMLSKFGYNPDLAANGLEALEAVKSRDYDLLLMDVQMPILDGEEATRRIRSELPQHRQPYIIALTADALEGRREFYLEIGMDDYLSKPMGIDHLVKAIDHYWAVKELAASSVLSPAVIAVEVLDAGRTIIDREIADEWIQAIGSQATFSSVVDGFFDNSSRLVNDIEKYYVSRNWMSLKMVCHGLKSSSDSMGAIQLSNLLSNLEAQSDAAINGVVLDEPLMTGLFAQIRQVHFQTCDELRLLQKELSRNSTPDGNQPPLAGRGGTSNEIFS